VYRTLDVLARIGIVQPALNAHKHLMYQIAGPEHHHLVCSDCGASVEIKHHAVDRLYQRLQASSGYRITGTHLTLFGLCPACRAKRQEE
jgi:Fur family ferric uptake transcriptional regulator